MSILIDSQIFQNRPSLVQILPAESCLIIQMYQQLIYVCQYCEKRYQKRKRLQNHLLKLHKVHVPANDSESPESSSESNSNYDSDTPKTSKTSMKVAISSKQSPKVAKQSNSDSSSDSENDIPKTAAKNKIPIKCSSVTQIEKTPSHNWAPKISKFAAEFSDYSDSEYESDKGVMVSLAKKVPLSKSPVTKQVSPGAGVPPSKLSSANKQDDSLDSSSIAAAIDEDSDSSDSSTDDNLTQSHLKLQNTPAKSQGISMKSQNNSKKKASSSSSSSEDEDSNTAQKPTISKPSNIKSQMNANANPSSKESSSPDSSDSDDDTSKQVSTKQNSLKRPLATTNLSNIPNKKKLATPSKNVNQTKKKSSLDSSSSEDETTLRENIPVKAKSTVSPLQKKVQEDSSSLESESDEDIKKKNNSKFNKAQDINASKRKKSSSESDEEAPDAGFQPPKKTKKEQQAFPLNQNNEIDNQYRDNRVTSASTKRDKKKKENLIQKLRKENAVLKKKLEDAALQNANEEYCAVVKIWEKRCKELKEILEDTYLEVDDLKNQLLNCKKNHSTHQNASTCVDAFTQTGEIKKDGSDSECELSLARVSPCSSVHTSDLSSFDDLISLSSEDENGEKKTVPLKEAIKEYLF